MTQFDKLYEEMMIQEDWKKAAASVGLAAATAFNPINAQARQAPTETPQTLDQRGPKDRVSVVRQARRQNLPRGIRNNNPGNIEKSNTKWDGKAKGEDSRFETFATPEYGIRAMAKVLLTYQRKYGINTVEGIINRWAPPVENNTDSYINHVSQMTGLKRDQELDLTKNAGQLFKLTKAIIKHENANYEYDYKTLLRGVQMAY